MRQQARVLSEQRIEAAALLVLGRRAEAEAAAGRANEDRAGQPQGGVALWLAHGPELHPAAADAGHGAGYVRAL